MGEKIDWYIRFSWLLILVATLLICTYYIINNINSCTAQPLDYAIKQVKEKFEIDYAFGTLTIVSPKGVSDRIDFGDINFSNSESSFETNFNSSLS